MATTTRHSLNAEYFSQAWHDFSHEEYDILIIGAGSVGAGTALDAATRGLKVAVVEAQDIAAGTSSRSSKMFHGGLRYLAMLDFALVAESLRERELSMSHIAPHLVKPLRFLFPLTSKIWQRPYMAAGFLLYDLMGGAKQVPMQKHYSKRGALKLAPSLQSDALVGGVRYYDTLVDDARHTLTVLRTAAEFGATIRTHTEVLGFIRDGERITGVRVQDTDSLQQTTIRAKVVINATGPWNDHINTLAGATGPFSVAASKGVHIVVPRSCIDSEVALTFVTEKSVLFVIPWENYWIIGTTDTAWKHSVDKPVATASDIRYILDHVNAKVTRPITTDDIVGVYAGLRPLVSGRSDSTTNLSRNHAVARVLPGFVAVAGGKYTTYRVIGADTVDLAVKELDHKVPASVTESIPLLGADGYHGLANQIPQLAARYQLSETQITHLLNRYGSLLDEVLQPAQQDPRLLQPLIGAEKYLLAELYYAITHEGARSLEDMLHRRMRIGMEYADRGRHTAQQYLDEIAHLCQWDHDTATTELAAFLRELDAQQQAEQALTDQAAVDILNQAAESAQTLATNPEA